MRMIVKKYLEMRGKIKKRDTDKYAINPDNFCELKKLTERLLSEDPAKAESVINE